MDPVNLVLPVGLMNASVITLAVCIGGRNGSARNSMVGIRLWSTKSSHAAWVSGNRAAKETLVEEHLAEEAQDSDYSS